VAVLPRTDAEAPGPDTAAVGLREPEFEHQVFLAWRPARRHGPAARGFLELAAAARQ
jgi:DNA-binding transcriptional LysR family regulator